MDALENSPAGQSAMSDERHAKPHDNFTVKSIGSPTKHKRAGAAARHVKWRAAIAPLLRCV
jgi:hypothetical protein